MTMEINAIELMGFLGHSSIHEPLDDYLHAHNIKKRPNNNGRNLEESVAIKTQGLHVCFVTSNKLDEEGLIAKSPGTYLFNWLDIYLIKQDGFSPYKGPLPFGLSQQMSQQQVRALLGQPPHVTFDVTWKSNVDFYFREGLVVAVKYTDMNGTAVSTLDARLPDNWAREQGIAPAV
jgi:hypothetical protein